MATKKTVIQTPRGCVFTTNGKGGKATARLEWNKDFPREHEQSFGRKQSFIDQDCVRKMAPETPRRTGALVKAATLGTVIGSGEIIQDTPYARRQYYEHKEKSYWFERMKNRHKDSILKGAQKIE